jgi:hypothetical protein
MSDDCEHPTLEAGQLVVQVGTAILAAGHPTPAGRQIDGQWHHDCFKKFALQPQSLPYACARCNKTIDDKSPVSYALVGFMRDDGITVELRGQIVQWIAHRGHCPA